jgi:predicted membrane chloride channel (bestrophin family)
MGMSGDNKNLIVTILAIIGGIVVLGWVLKITFALLGPLILIGIAVLIYMMFAKNKGSGV